jgi:diacylglycerol kinase (ATP)
MEAGGTRTHARPEASSVALISNLRSGSGDASRAAELLRSLGAEVRELELGEASTDDALEAERVVVAGGDGSVAAAAALAHVREVPLAVIPTGTANDFARALRLPLDLEPAVRLAVAGPVTHRLDLAWVTVDERDPRPFVNAASAGLSPVAARQAGRLKQRLGSLAYSLGAVRAGLRARPLPCEVRCGDRTVFSGSAWQVTVSCTGAFGGGAEVDADPQDGMLDATVMEAGSRLRLIRYAYGLRAGRVEAQEGVAKCAGEGIGVETDGSTGFNVDGELVAGATARCEIAPRAFEVVTG